MPSQSRFVRTGVVSLALFAACTSTAVAGPDWVEVGDAGSTVFTAQLPVRPFGAVQLETISGGLSSGVGVPDYEDLYFIRILEPSTFSVTTEFADFDAQLYLFNITVNHELFGLLANNNRGDESLLPGLLPASTDGTSVIITQPGDYVLGIAGAGRTPVSRSGAIFNLASPTEISGADGPGGINPLSDWTGVGQTGRYTISFTSTDFPVMPAPGTGVAAALGLTALGARRRRVR